MPNEFSSLQHYFYSIFKDLPQFIMKTLPEAKRIRHTSPNSIWTQFLSNPGLIIVYACHWLTDRKSLILLSTLASLPQKSPKTCDFFKLLHFWRIFMNSHQITGRRRRSSGRAEKGGSPATLNLTHHYSHDNLESWYQWSCFSSLSSSSLPIPTFLISRLSWSLIAAERPIPIVGCGQLVFSIPLCCSFS